MKRKVKYIDPDITEQLVEEPQLYMFDELEIIEDKESSFTHNSNIKKIRVFETFAGYGGASFGLKRAKIPHEIIGYSEIDSFPRRREH
jgi:hypothetical protein